MSKTTDKRNTIVITQSHKDIEYKIDIATQTLERNIGFIVNCDNKASIMLSVLGVLLTIILTNDGLFTISKIINHCTNNRTFCNMLYLLSFISSIFLMVLGIINLGNVLVAKVSEEASGITEGNSHIFFSGIHKSGNYEFYHNKFCSLTKAELLDELISQIYINADIAAKKYHCYNTGFRLSTVGFISFVCILLIGIYIY